MQATTKTHRCWWMQRTKPIFLQSLPFLQHSCKPSAFFLNSTTRFCSDKKHYFLWNSHVSSPICGCDGEFYFCFCLFLVFVRTKVVSVGSNLRRLVRMLTFFLTRTNWADLLLEEGMNWNVRLVKRFYRYFSFRGGFRTRTRTM